MSDHTITRRRKHSNDVKSVIITPKEMSMKIVIVGDYGVGKTAIIRRYTYGKFSSTYKLTIGADFTVKQLQWKQAGKINLQLWDLAGHERFQPLSRVYYKYAVAAIIVFDLSRAATFHSVKEWVKTIRENVELQDGSPLPVILFANKCDIPGNSVILSEESITHLCEHYGLSGWYTTSAKENINIEKGINDLISQIVNHSVEQNDECKITLKKKGNLSSSNSVCCS